MGLWRHKCTQGDRSTASSLPAISQGPCDFIFQEGRSLLSSTSNLRDFSVPLIHSRAQVHCAPTMCQALHQVPGIQSQAPGAEDIQGGK